MLPGSAPGEGRGSEAAALGRHCLGNGCSSHLLLFLRSLLRKPADQPQPVQLRPFALDLFCQLGELGLQPHALGEIQPLFTAAGVKQGLHLRLAFFLLPLFLTDRNRAQLALQGVSQKGGGAVPLNN